MKRSAFSKDLNKTIEFIVEAERAPLGGTAVDFTISPSSLENLRDRQKVHCIRVSRTRERVRIDEECKAGKDSVFNFICDHLALHSKRS